MLKTFNDIAKRGGKEMTGRDLIVFVMEHRLENEMMISRDGAIAGLLTLGEAANKLNVGIATVLAWITREEISEYYIIGNAIYIPQHLINNLLKGGLHE